MKNIYEVDILSKYDEKNHRTTKSAGINIIIPVSNEASNIEELLERIDVTMTSSNIIYKAIIIDDYSNDGTLEIAKKFVARKEFPMWVRAKKGKKGKTFSLIEGLSDEQANFAIVAIIDGDLQYPPEILPKMIQPLASSLIGVVVGERFPKYRKAYFLRGYLSELFNLLFFWLFGIKTDVQSGIKVFRRELYDPIVVRSSSSWIFDVDLIVQTAYKGFQIMNIPIDYQKRKKGTSKVLPLKVGIELLIRILQLKFILITHQPLVVLSSHIPPHKSSSSNISEKLM